MFLDLQEGILLEFAERASRSIEDDIYQRYGISIVHPRENKAPGMASLRALRAKQSLCLQCGKPAEDTQLCAKHNSEKNKRDRVRYGAKDKAA